MREEETEMTDLPTFDPLSLDRESILEEARLTAGSADFGDESFREPFERLVAALDSEARLNAVGKGMQRARIVGLLVNRLRTEAYIARYPEILDEQIREHRPRLQRREPFSARRSRRGRRSATPSSRPAPTTTSPAVLRSRSRHLDGRLH